MLGGTPSGLHRSQSRKSQLVRQFLSEGSSFQGNVQGQEELMSVQETFMFY